MSTSLVAGYLPGITPEQLNAAKRSERTPATPSIAPRQQDAEDSFVSAWVLIGTILSCLVTMIGVVITAAATMP